MNCTSPDIVQEIIKQMQSSPAWKLRKEAAQLLIHLGNYTIETWTLVSF